MVGKRIRNALYIHESALAWLPAIKWERVRIASSFCELQWNVARIEPNRIGLLLYRDFDLDPFPALAASWSFATGAAMPSTRDFSKCANPPILHRKELLVAPDHPRRREWSNVTARLTAAGAFRDPHRIGTRERWAERLRQLEITVTESPG